MENPLPMDYSEEEKRLSDILLLLKRRLEVAKQESEQQMTGLQDTRRDEFTERSEPLLKNLWAAHRFEDLVHLSQEFQNAADEEKDHENTLKLISSLQKMQLSPYFARIDLQFEEDEEPEKIYIGRHSLWDDQKENLLIYDWRAPISSVFYRFGAGPAFYKAPAGKIECDLLLKRQYEISDGRLIGFFDADTVIQDSFLRRLLAQNASSQMKAIVETIQRDQDAAIRDEDHDLLMVQGAAGSGKTSIAMHRVAYLMYEGLKNPLKANNILILSPNTVFEKYISGVLPELGERSVATTTLDQLLEELLSLPIKSRLEEWEAYHGLTRDEHAAADQLKSLLSSQAFSACIDNYVNWLPAHLPCEDISYAGRVIASREEIRGCISEKNAKFPLAVRLRRLEDMLWERVHALRPDRLNELRMLAFRLGRGEEFARGISIWECGVLARKIHQITRLDILKLYQNMLLSAGRISSPLSNEDAAFLSHGSSSLSLPLSLSHASAMAYLMLRLSFGEASGDIRQMVVDEAQDYTYMDYAVLGALFPKARFTVVGDVRQALEKQVDEGLYDDIAKALPLKNPVLLTLYKSFRCTRQILEFSLRYLPPQRIECLNREGAEPRVLPYDRLEEEIALCQEKGYQSIALITKTEKEAEAWLQKLSPRIEIRLMGKNAQVNDVFLAPLPLSKGLEFDAVLLLDYDEAHYGGPEGPGLVYVACTRALHRLSLFSADGQDFFNAREVQNA